MKKIITHHHIKPFEKNIFQKKFTKGLKYDIIYI